MLKLRIFLASYAGKSREVEAAAAAAAALLLVSSEVVDILFWLAIHKGRILLDVVILRVLLELGGDFVRTVRTVDDGAHPCVTVNRHNAA